jgi:hypothetical protein
MISNEALNTPVLINAFSRYDTTLKVFEAVRSAKPTKLYFACDGPRTEKERLQTDRVRGLVELVDWPCDVHRLFHPKNMGLKKAMVANLDWFFEHEPEGIVLEDDTAPVPSFFPFCQALLKHYRENERIWWILGSNLMADPDPKPEASYYFSEHGYGAPWGWAGWRRSWVLYDVAMKAWPSVRNTPTWNEFFLSRAERSEADFIFEATWDGRIPTTWAFQNDFARILNKGLTVIPEYNLVRNIGFSDAGTNTLQATDRRDVDNAYDRPFELVHPDEVVVDAARDLGYFNKFVRPNFFRRFRTAVKSLIPTRVDAAITPYVSKILRRIGS